jgi:hypothetical protein
MAPASPFVAALAPLAAQLRQREALVRPVSQVTIRLPVGDTSFIGARNEVLRWMDRRAGRTLPKCAWDGESFELEDVGAQRTAAVSIGPTYWAARLDDADREVAQRVWTTEIGIGRNAGGSILFGCRLLCVIRGEEIPFERSIPGFVRRVVEKFEARLDGRAISSAPWLVENEADVEELVSLLRDPQRQTDVVVLALPEEVTDPRQTAIAADEFALKTLAAAHVAVITGPASFFLSDHIGKEFSVFRQAVRTYKTGFDPNEDEPFNHPLALPSRIATWPDGGPVGYQRFLVDRTLAASAAVRNSEQRLPIFTAVRRAAAEFRSASARDAGSSDADLLKLAEEEIATLKKGLDEERETNGGLLKVVEGERDQTFAEVEQIKETNQHLRARIKDLEQRLVSRGDGTAQVPIPKTLNGFETWCATHLAGHVQMHNRAFQGVNKSQYEDIALIYRSLLLLKDLYVPMRREGGAERMRNFESACRQLGLSEESSISDARAGEEGDTYFVKYAGRRRKLDRHLKKGSSREARLSFRLYFFWDEEEEQVIVGWLPSHLDIRIT